MNFKTTGILILVLAILSGYIYYDRMNRVPPPRRETTFVYQLDISDIARMDVQYRGQTVSVKWDETNSEWYFTDQSDKKVHPDRANGLRVLLSGPGANRVLLTETATPEQLKEYGLVEPQVVATIALKTGRVHRVLLGDRTPDGNNYYIKNGDRDGVYLVDFTWGNEILRFVAEPPIVTPTPEQDSSG